MACLIEENRIAENGAFNRALRRSNLTRHWPRRYDLAQGKVGKYTVPWHFPLGARTTHLPESNCLKSQEACLLKLVNAGAQKGKHNLAAFQPFANAFEFLWPNAEQSLEPVNHAIDMDPLRPCDECDRTMIVLNSGDDISIPVNRDGQSD
jgi:hypothetical protein